MSSDKKIKNPSRTFWLPFITKLRLLMTFLVLVFSLFFLTFFVYHTRNTGIHELKRDGVVVSQDLAWESELGVLANDPRYLETPLENHHKREEVIYTMIYDKEGVLLAEKSKLNLAPPLPDKPFTGLGIDQVKSDIIKFNDSRIYEFILPITSVDIKQSQETLMFEPERKLSRPYVPSKLSKTKKTEERNIIGFVRMGFSFDRLETDINEIIKIGLSVTGMFLVLGILITYYIAQVLTRPITTLTEGVKAIINGNLKQEIHIHSQDEFAGLADAFNEMTKRLRTRMEEIRQKNEELESFAHTVSHDLKAPLISIQGFSSMLQKKHENGLGEKGKFYLERIQKNVEHMDRLIHDLLRLSRIGRTKVVMGPVEMESVIKEVIGELMLPIKERSINIEITDDLPVVYGNKTQVYQIVSNLISNAVKFIGDTPQPKIEITSEKIDNYYKIGVKDNGIGIDEKHYDRIFSMFQRLDDKTEGTGVGLAIVKRLVEMEGGEVMLESEPGKGTAFYVTIPAKKYQKI